MAQQTPYYLIKTEDLRYDCDLLYGALTDFWGDNFIMGYSVKTNSLPWLLTYLLEKGFYAEVVSKTEADLVKRLGFRRNHVIYNGPIKDKEVFEDILLNGGIVNMDSSYEPVWLERLAQNHPDKEFEVGIRVNCDIKSMSPEEELLEEDGGRFGYCYENGELENVINKLDKLSNVKLTGIHLHSSTKSRSVYVFERLAAFAVKLSEEFGLKLKYVDMGGGYFGGRADMPDYRDYFEGICRELKKGFDPDKVTLVVEPGVSLISRAMSFVTSVLDVKRIRDNRYLVTDGSRVNLNPQVTRHSYPHHIFYMDDNTRGYMTKEEAKTQRSKASSQWVCGSTCMEYDRLFEIKDDLKLKAGDKIVYDTAGGYTMCLSPLFINYFPAVFVENEDGTRMLVREAWGNDEYLQKCRY